jgi:hypothetical protein
MLERVYSRPRVPRTRMSTDSQAVRQSQVRYGALRMDTFIFSVRITEDSLDGFACSARQRKIESAAQANVALDPDSTVVGFDNALRDCQSQPNAAPV